MMATSLKWLRELVGRRINGRREAPDLRELSASQVDAAVGDQLGPLQRLRAFDGALGQGSSGALLDLPAGNPARGSEERHRGGVRAERDLTDGSLADRERLLRIPPES